jgi:hypothetical protein
LWVGTAVSGNVQTLRQMIKLRLLFMALLLGLAGLMTCPSGQALRSKSFFTSAAVETVETSFLSTIPASGGSQKIQTSAGELAQIAVASLHNAVPLASWIHAGWSVGPPISPTEPVPVDCALHARQGIAYQLYALCPSEATFTVPNDGADFIYVVLMDRQHRIRKTLQTGELYRLDAAGLVA